jgi:hypothetical protein
VIVETTALCDPAVSLRSTAGFYGTILVKPTIDLFLLFSFRQHTAHIVHALPRIGRSLSIFSAERQRVPLL